MLHNIPFELQQLDQWVVATGVIMPDGKRNKVPLNPRTGKKADPTDRSTWGSFQEAMACGYPLVGFVLSKEDPYCIIDLDPPETDEQIERHQKILEAFETYAELSQSGNGMHIICRASVPHGVRRDKVEVYSDSRYMICTGVTYKELPIVDCQALVDDMFKSMNADQPRVGLVQYDSLMSDDDVLAMAQRAVNGHKFCQLWQGEWRGVPEWPSQSEADFALLSMLGFYTNDNAQVRRLFRLSELGKRDKAVRNDTYIDHALSKIRAKKVPFIDFTKLLRGQTVDRENSAGPGATQGSEATDPGAIESNAQANPDRETGAVTDEHSSHQIQAKETRIEFRADGEGGGEIGSGEAGATAEAIQPRGADMPRDGGERALDYPPGFIGELAQYFYSSAIRPVPEIALAAAIALTAGVAGRTYNISGSGLNQYLVVIARTGSGKEGAAKAIDMMVSAVRSRIPMVEQFIGPGAFASGQGLLRALDKQECFVSVLGEIGLTLQTICDIKAGTAQIMLKKVLLDIYAKSGYNSILRPSVYSETEKNTKVVQAPNVTIFGESTPESFYDALDATAIAQGLVPRFSIFEYDGPRPKRNAHAFTPPTKALVDKFADLLTVALAAQQNRVHCPVQVDADAQQLFDQFDSLCDDRMNADKGDVNLQLWNRAHLKALKMGALIAVGENPNMPIVSASAAQWAISLTERDIAKLLSHFAAGDIGSGDTRMEADLRRAVNDYLALRVNARREYQIAERIIEHPIVPIGYLRRRLRGLASFRNDRRGANAALAAIIKALCEAGELQQVPPLQAIQEFGINTPLYTIGSAW